MRAERTRSLSPEKMASTTNLQAKTKETTSLLNDDSNIPSLSKDTAISSLKLSKADEIKKTIESIAGPSGTLPLFPSLSQSSQKPASSSKSEIPKVFVQTGVFEKKEKTPVSEKSLKPSPFPNSENYSARDIFNSSKLTSVSKTGVQTSPKNETHSNNFITSPLKSIAGHGPSHRQEKYDDDVPFADFKLRPTAQSSKNKSSNLLKNGTVVGSTSNGKKEINHLDKGASVDKDKIPSEKLKDTSTKKTTPKALPPKPRSLSSQKVAPKTKPTENDSRKESEENYNAEMAGEIRTEDNEKEAFEPLKSSLSETKIVAPVPTSLVLEHKSSSVAKGNDKLDQITMGSDNLVLTSGTTPLLQPPIRPRESSPTTPPPPERSRSIFHSPIRQPITSSSKFSPSTVNFKTSSSSISPAGSFLASRSSASISISRQTSPSRGGFVQSAMLKRESTIFRPRSDSTSSATSPNIFDGISLAAPTDKPTSSKPLFRHSRTQSATTIETGNGNFGKHLGDSWGHKPSRSDMNGDNFAMSQNGYDFPPKNSDKGTKAETDDETGLHYENLKKSFASPSRSSSRLVEERIPSTAHSPSASLKYTDSRRWSPTRQTWLSNALKKTSQHNSSGLEPSASLSNRIPTLKSSSPTKTARANSFITEKPVFSKAPELPLSRSIKSSKPEHLRVGIEKTATSKERNEKLDNHFDTKELLEKDTNKPPTPPPSRGSDTREKVLAVTVKDEESSLPEKPVDRSQKTRPAVPKKPDLSVDNSTKPKLPVETLAKLRELRSGVSLSSAANQASGKNLGKPSPSIPNSNKLNKSIASLKSVTRLVKPDEDIEDDFNHYNPPLLSRPSVFNHQDGQEVSPKLPPRKTVVAKHTTPLPPVPDQLKNKTHSADAVADEENPVMEARRVLFGPSAAEKAQKEADEKLYNSPHIPSMLNKKTAKSFASDLSAVLQRGKPLVTMKYSGKSFSPSFEGRIAGIHKAHTFDTVETARTNYSLEDIAEPSNVELTHMTKGRSKGPCGRRPPKAVSGKAPAVNSNSVRINGFQAIHQRQRSRSLSPGQIRKANALDFTVKKPTPLPHKPLPTPPSAASKGSSARIAPAGRPRYSFEPESDDEVPNAPLSRKSSSDESSLAVPKQRRHLPAVPDTPTKPKDDKSPDSSHNANSTIPASLTPGERPPVFDTTGNSIRGPGVLGRADSTLALPRSGTNTPRNSNIGYESIPIDTKSERSVIRKSSQTVANNLLKSKELVEKFQSKGYVSGKHFDQPESVLTSPALPEAISCHDGGSNNQSPIEGNTKSFSVKPNRPIPPVKPRNLSSSLKQS